MTIDEAIKSLSEQIHLFRARLNPDLKDALKLGIEALKVIQNNRGYPAYIIPHHLPGETEE